MSIFTSFGIIIISMLILGLLQLVPGIFALFSHYALGKFSKAKASDFALFFILGVEVISACFFLSTYFLMSILLIDNAVFENGQLAWGFAGLLIALAVFCLIFYYRRGKGSKLFIPRTYSEAIDHNAKTVKNRSGAFLLGLLSSSCELILTLPLYLIVAVQILKIESLGLPANLIAIVFILAPIVPLFFTYWQYRYGYNLADIMKRRSKIKPFIRITLSICYSILAILIIQSGAL